MVASARARGFTLPELLAVVAVLAILAGIAAPSFTSLTGTMRERGASSALYASLALARSEAIKRNAPVTLQPNSGGWSQGWFTLDPANQGRKLDDQPAIPNGTVTGPDFVTFLGNGRVDGGGRPAFDIYVNGASQHRCVRLDLSGRPNQSSTGC